MGDGSDICTLVVRAAAKMSQETIGRVGTPGCEGTAGRIPFYARGRIHYADPSCSFAIRNWSMRSSRDKEVEWEVVEGCAAHMLKNDQTFVHH